MENKIDILGIDVGSVSVSVAGITIENSDIKPEIKIIYKNSVFHHGNIANGLESALS
ncbi:MAG: hypothetical protein HQK65_07735, partial [Desulfamplus sp.]|nr:hypothetical protein [Desulfamplus sp.]